MRPALAAAVLAAVTLAGCSEEAPALGGKEPTAASEVSSVLEDGAVVIDVRTPSEFAAGHLADALNIDVESDDSEGKVEALDMGKAYLVYCRTGSRAGRAIETMTALGFTSLVNGGAFDALAAAGVPTS